MSWIGIEKDVESQDFLCFKDIRYVLANSTVCLMFCRKQSHSLPL